MDKQLLAGKVALITGGGRGMGLEMARAFAAAGAAGVAVLSSSSPNEVGAAVEEIDHIAGRKLGLALTADVRDDAVAEEGRDPCFGSIVKLVRKHDVERVEVFLQRADRARRENPLRAKLLEAVNICPEVQLRRQDRMVAIVAREKGHAASFERAHPVGVGRGAEGRIERHFLDIRQPFHLIEAAASHDSDTNVTFHVLPAPTALRAFLQGE